MAEALMEEAPSTAADIPVLKGAGILTAALAALAAFRPLTWAAATSAADEEAMARTRSRGDFHLVRPAISRAIPTSGAAASPLRQLPAISGASEARNRRRRILATPWAGGNRLETRQAGPCWRRPTFPGMRWEAGGVPSETSAGAAGRKHLAALGTPCEMTPSGIRLEIREALPSAAIVRDFPLSRQAACRQRI
jgi:hypothetical protein